MTNVEPNTVKYYKSLINFKKKPKGFEEKIDMAKIEINNQAPEDEAKRWDTWNIRGPKNTRILARNKLRFFNTDLKVFKNHLKKTRELGKTFDHKLMKKINIYNIPKGVYPKIQNFSQYYKVDTEEYSDCWKVRISLF